MPKSYPLEIRQKILEAIDSGKTIWTVAAEFNVEPRTIDNYIRYRKEGKDLAPTKPSQQGPVYEVIKPALQQDVRLSQDKLADLVSQAGITASLRTIQRVRASILKELGIDKPIRGRRCLRRL